MKARWQTFRKKVTLARRLFMASLSGDRTEFDRVADDIETFWLHEERRRKRQ